MKRLAQRLSFGVVLMLVACSGSGGSSPTAPTTPTPPSGPTGPSDPTPPTVITVAGTITNTVSGAHVGTFTHEVSRLPALIPVSAAGFVERLALVTQATATVDLIPEAGFDLDFYRQLARGTQSGRMDPLRVLGTAPSFYMEVEGPNGFSAAVGAQLEQLARELVPAFTGGRFQVTRWETGPTPRAPQAGWIMIERADLEICGDSFVGDPAGHIRLDGDTGCRVDATFAHELGHALGFWHVNDLGALMASTQASSNVNDTLTPKERHHAAIAYSRSRGNQDIDQDVPTSSAGAAPRSIH